MKRLNHYLAALKSSIILETNVAKDLITFIHERIKAKGLLSVIGSVNHYFLRLPPLFLDRVARIGKNLDPPLFDKICIQTQTECNYNCPFCPNNKVERPHGVMSFKLYKKIIDELSSLKFSGVIYPYIQEPLLDKRIVKLCEYASEKCPKASIIVETNGSLLTQDLAQKLCSIPKLKIIVNDYTPRNSVIKRILKFDLSFGERAKIILRKRSFSERLTNRAGNISELKKPLKNFCIIPFVEFYVAFDGKVLLCCQDWKHEEIMGNITNSSLEEVWYGEKYRVVRKQLLRLNRIGLCSKCDYWGVE